MGTSFCSRVFPFLAIGLIAAAIGCQFSSNRLEPEDGVLQLPGVRAEYPPLRYRDGQVSLNDSCMIRTKNPLNRRIPPLYVNGRPVGFC